LAAETGYATGRLIDTFTDKKQAAAYYSIHRDALRFSSGVYFCRIHANKPTSRGVDRFSDVEKCIFMK
jgi:hypothetical protein